MDVPVPCEREVGERPDVNLSEIDNEGSQVPKPSSSRRKRKVEQNSLAEFLKTKKEKEWMLEQRKLDLDEQIIKLKKRRLELDEAKFKKMCEILDKQNETMNLLLQKLLDK